MINDQSFKIACRAFFPDCGFHSHNPKPLSFLIAECVADRGGEIVARLFVSSHPSTRPGAVVWKAGQYFGTRTESLKVLMRLLKRAKDSYNL